ncbi:hypothetical protein SAMN05421504_104539 [Amycolatopsis xylanica]|uniref:Uncharacterized protein n=1 Tax=Amycolatopsis xylanica TaxID=589385 RepID=A0A1H3H6C9_9PSEU|nr:hypothetical protein [Amycolatopsis xylanica]SDY11123.1 hypothetical protein SAMN05421504_104539 [Amycolatopsis xylanica]
MRWLKFLLGNRVPDGFDGELAPGEHVLDSAKVDSGGFLLVTPLGLWIPGPRRVGWHMIAKAAWADGVFTLTEAEETGKAGAAVVLADLKPVTFKLSSPGSVPRMVHQRVTGSIRARHRQELPGGGAWFVQRKLPGQDGVVLQVRPDPGTDPALVADIAAEAAGKLANPGA